MHILCAQEGGRKRRSKPECIAFRWLAPAVAVPVVLRSEMG